MKELDYESFRKLTNIKPINRRLEPYHQKSLHSVKICEIDDVYFLTFIQIYHEFRAFLLNIYVSEEKQNNISNELNQYLHLMTDEYYKMTIIEEVERNITSFIGDDFLCTDLKYVDVKKKPIDEFIHVATGFGLKPFVINYMSLVAIND